MELIHPGLMGHNVVCTVAEDQKVLTFSVGSSVTKEIFLQPTGLQHKFRLS
jgi:hypothetical protein